MASFRIGNPFCQRMLPEYELEGYWTCDIKDDKGMLDNNGRQRNNSIFVGEYMPLGFDAYVQSVSIPQLSLDYENKNYGLMMFKEKSPYDDVTITFYDDLYTINEKAWNICYNEILSKFITFYSWIPSFSTNIDNIFFSFDRNDSNTIAKW